MEMIIRDDHLKPLYNSLGLNVSPQSRFKFSVNGVILKKGMVISGDDVIKAEGIRKTVNNVWAVPLNGIYSQSPNTYEKFYWRLRDEVYSGYFKTAEITLREYLESGIGHVAETEIPLDYTVVANSYSVADVLPEPEPEPEPSPEPDPEPSPEPEPNFMIVDNLMLDELNVDQTELYINNVKAVYNDVIRFKDYLQLKSNVNRNISNARFFRFNRFGDLIEQLFKVVNNNLAVITPDEWVIGYSDLGGNNESLFRLELNTVSNVRPPNVRDVSGNNRVYLLDKVILNQLNRVNFNQIINEDNSDDYSNFVISMIKIPFNVDLEGYKTDLENIRVSSYDLKTSDYESVMAYALNADVITLDLGVIRIEPLNHNLTDFKSVKCILNLPYIDKIELDPEYVINQDINVLYDIDVYTGKLTVNIKSSVTGESIITSSTSLGFNVPLGGFNYRNSKIVTDSNIEISGDNGIRTAFIEVIQPEFKLIDGAYTIPVEDEGVLSSFEGFLQVDNIDIKGFRNSFELDQIKSILNDGVFINVN